MSGATGAPGGRKRPASATAAAAQRTKVDTSALPACGDDKGAGAGPAAPYVPQHAVVNGCHANGAGRPQSSSVASLDAVVAALRGAKHVVVLAGAGISVSCGVPDFRSPTGLYALVAELGLAVGEPEDLFDMETFADTPELFYEFAHKIWPSGAITPSPTHRFVRALADRRKLRRIYTQNVDGLERVAGVPTAKIIECHGTVRTSRCLRCRKVVDSSTLTADVMAKRVPECPKCKRGVMKPEITFFGEAIAPKVFKTMETDKNKADLLLVVGTTLAVAGVTQLLQLLPHTIPQVLINRDSIAPPRSHQSEGFDVELLGDCDNVFGYLADRIGLDVPCATDGAAALPTPQTPTPTPTHTPTHTHQPTPTTAAPSGPPCAAVDLPENLALSGSAMVSGGAGAGVGKATGPGYLVTVDPFNERSVAICLE